MGSLRAHETKEHMWLSSLHSANLSLWQFILVPPVEARTYIYVKVYAPKRPSTTENHGILDIWDTRVTNSQKQIFPPLLASLVFARR